MKIFTTKQQVREWRKEVNGTLGFVPTMGYLHEGHAELLRQSVASCDATILSIFVNPTQFGPTEDLDRYPRDFERDTQLAKEIGVDAIFYPSVEEMYHASSTISFHSGEMSNALCGKSRPGHFDGVLQVVTKLFHIVEPDDVFFGQKDAQQLALIESLVEAYDFPLTVHRVPTVRESDGLAKSSRNVYLTADERQQAPMIYKALVAAKEHYIQTGSRDEAVAVAREQIEQHTSGTIDYLELLSYPSLQNDDAPVMIIAAAVFFSKARLIDNLLIERVNTHA